MSIAIDSQTVLKELLPRRAAVRDGLGQLRRRIRRQLVLEGLLWTWGTAVVLAAVSLAADRWLRTSVAVRVATWPLAVGLLLAIGYRRLVRPMRLRLEDLDVAMLLDRRYPGLSQKAASVLQLPRLLEGKPQASPSIVRAAVIEHAGALEQVDFRAVLEERRRARCGGLLAAAVVLPAVFLLLWPGVARFL